jgi:hypothetical protein
MKTIMRWPKHAARTGKMTPIGSPRSRREDNIKMYLKESECEIIDWNHLPHGNDGFFVEKP